MGPAIMGVLALLSAQPWGVLYALLLPGVVGAIVIGGNLVVIFKRYREWNNGDCPRRILFSRAPPWSARGPLAPLSERRNKPAAGRGADPHLISDPLATL